MDGVWTARAVAGGGAAEESRRGGGEGFAAAVKWPFGNWISGGAEFGPDTVVVAPVWLLNTPPGFVFPLWLGLPPGLATPVAREPGLTAGDIVTAGTTGSAGGVVVLGGVAGDLTSLFP